MRAAPRTLQRGMLLSTAGISWNRLRSWMMEVWRVSVALCGSAELATSFPTFAV